MSKHTPGPWKSEGKRFITTVGIAISTDKSLGPIAVVSEENAPLVLAAPEMYEAISQMVAIINESEGISGWHLNGDLLRWEQCEPAQKSFPSSPASKVKNEELKAQNYRRRGL